MPVRVGRRGHGPGRLSLLALLVCLLLAEPCIAAPPGRKAPKPDRKPVSARLVVTSNSGKATATPGQLSLHDAITQAAVSSIPITIEFDADAFSKSSNIALVDPITLASTAASVQIDGSGLKAEVTIDASACADAGIQVSGDAQLTLRGLTVRGGKQRVILCKDRARLLLDNVTICDGAMPGIAAFGQSRLVLADSRLQSNRTHGLELHGQCTARLDRVDLSKNGQSGIAAFDSSFVAVMQSRLDSNGEWGVVLADECKAELTNCTIRRSHFANVDMSGSANVVLTGCELLQGQRFGLFATGGANAQLNSTRIASSGSRGIEAQDHSSLSLTGCRVESSVEYGLILFGQGRATASECSFNNNGAHGASLRGTASGEFTKCEFTGNRFSGLGCLDARDGGVVRAKQCVFRQNGMRPIYRGPLHIDPLVPTPLKIEGSRVRCMVDPGASVELYLDRAGEASRYIGVTQADKDGRFDLDTSQIPVGSVVTAAATINGATSEFNVVAGSPSAPLMHALLGRTGPFSDEGGDIDLDMLVRRWPPRSRVVFKLDQMPSVAVDKYVHFLVGRIPEWTTTGLTADVSVGSNARSDRDGVIIPVHYVGADAEQLASRGGVTYMRWDSNGFFLPPMEIVLALGRETHETCPRVLAHEIGHALGLCHARVGLLSRMQGSAAPGAGYVNDFSPMMTYYDVLALQALHDPRNTGGVTLRQLVQRGTIPSTTGTQVAAARSLLLEPTFSPRPAEPPTTSGPSRNNRP